MLLLISYGLTVRAWTVSAGLLDGHDERALTIGVVGGGFTDYPELTRVATCEQLNAIGQQRHAGEPEGRIDAPCLRSARRTAPCGLVTLPRLA